MVPHLLVGEHTQRVTARAGLCASPFLTFNRVRLRLLRRSRRRMVVLRGHVMMRVQCRLSGVIGVVIPVPRVRRVVIVWVGMCRRVAAIWTRHDGTGGTGRRSGRVRSANAVEGAFLRDGASTSDCSLTSS